MQFSLDPISFMASKLLQNFVEIILWMCGWNQNLFDLNNRWKLASEMGLDGPDGPTQMSSCVTNIPQQHTEYQISSVV